MVFYSSNETCVSLVKDNIPHASLAGRSPSSLKNEVEVCLPCHGESFKGLETKALNCFSNGKLQQIFAVAVLHVAVEIQWFCQLHCWVDKYVGPGRSKMVLRFSPTMLLPRQV